MQQKHISIRAGYYKHDKDSGIGVEICDCLREIIHVGFTFQNPMARMDTLNVEDDDGEL